MQKSELHPSTQTSSNSEDKVGKILLATAQQILVAVCGLFPLLFLPTSLLPIGYSKLIILIFGVALALVFYSLYILREGKFSFQLPWGMVALWAVALISLVSALFSGDVHDSLAGDILSSNTAAFLVLLAILVPALGMLRNSKQSIVRLYALFILSALSLGVFHLARLAFGAETISLGIFSAETASPLGGWNSLAIFYGLTISLCMVALEQLTLTRAGKVLVGAAIFVGILVLAIVNFFIVWIVLAIASALMLVYGLMKPRFKNRQLQIYKDSPEPIGSIIMSLFIFVVSVIFLFGGSQLGNALSDFTGISFTEVRPSVSATIDITRNVWSDNLLLGTGPNKFVDAWRMYKNKDINETIFWNTDFDSGSSYVMTAFVQTGLLGMLAWTFFLIAFVVGGIRMILHSGTRDRFWYFIGVFSYVAAVYLWGMSLVYVPQSTSLVIAAVCTGIFYVSYMILIPGKTYTLSIEENRSIGFFMIGIVMVLIVGASSSVYLMSKQALAIYTFNDAIASVQPGDTLESLEKKIAQAYLLSPSDVFVRQVAVYQLDQLNSFLTVTEPTEAQLEAFNTAAYNGLQSAELAVKLDPTEPRNYQVLGQLYSTLAFMKIEGAGERSENAFNQATMYDSKNPALSLLKAQLASRMGDLTKARSDAEAAVALRSRYTDAIYFLVQIDVVEGNTDKAIARTRDIIRLEKENPAHWYQLGLLYASQNKVDETIASFEQAVVLDPSYANAHYFLALGYVEKGNREKAIKHLTIVSGLNESNKIVDQLITKLKENGEIDTSVTEASPVTENADSNDEDKSVTSDDLSNGLVTSPNVVADGATTETGTDSNASSESQ